MEKNNLLTDNITKLLFNLGMPFLVGLIANYSIFSVDTYFVSLLGTPQLTAMGFFLPINDISLAIAISLGVAIASLIARRRNQLLSVAIIHSGLVWGIIIFIVLGTIVYTLFHQLTVVMNINQNIIPYLKPVTFVYLAGYIITISTSVLAFALNAVGQIKITGIALICGALANLILDPLLIFGLWFIPRMGIVGVAYATILSRFIILLILFFYLKPYYPSIYQYNKRFFLLCINSVRKRFAPIFITNLIPPCTIFVLIALLATTSNHAVAAFGIASRLELILLTPLIALTGCIPPLVGQNYTAHHHDRVAATLKQSVVFCLIWGFFVYGLLLIFAPNISHIFSKQASIVNYTTAYLYIVPLSYFAWGIAMSVNNYLNVLSFPYLATGLTILHYLILAIPLAILGLKVWQAIGIFAAIAMSNIIVGAIAYVCSRIINVRLSIAPK